MVVYDKDINRGYGVETQPFTVHSYHTQVICEVICPIPSIGGQSTPFGAFLSPIIQASGVVFNLHNNIWNTN